MPRKVSARDLITQLMGTLDDVWLTHNHRIRFNATVTDTDLRLEAALFKMEAALQAAKAQLVQHADIVTARKALSLSPSDRS